MTRRRASRCSFPTTRRSWANPDCYLEDLYVAPEWRGHGFGRALLTELARIAVARGCGRFEWSVLDWNEPAIGFYQSLGAKLMDGWSIFRVTGEALTKLASSDLKVGP